MESIASVPLPNRNCGPILHRLGDTAKIADPLLRRHISGPLQ